MKTPLLEVKGLTVSLNAAPGTRVLDNVSFSVAPGMILGAVGASGSGKTTLGLALLGLISPAMRLRSGRILIEGEDIMQMSASALRHLRGARVGMVFQEPASAFDPVFTVGEQILEAMAAHHPSAGRLARQKLLDLLAMVEVPDPARVAAAYPHELSGGLRQRAMLAMALSVKPSLLVADEPTSSCDVTVQAKLMALFRKLRRDLGLSIVLISHDLGMVRRLADEMIILSRGRIVPGDHPEAKALLTPEDM